MSPIAGLTYGKDDRIPPRARILAVAEDLFYRHGIRAVGVDAIAEAAGTNKMTLYRHFGSKDDLVAAYLRQAAEEADGCWARLEQAHPGDRPGAATRLARGDGGACRQCRPARLPACQCRRRAAGKGSSGPAGDRGVQDGATRQAHRSCAAPAGLSEPDMLADELHLLLEGARVTAQSVGSDDLGARLVRMGEAMIAAHAAK